MIYDPRNADDLKEIKAKLNYFYTKSKKVEIKEYRKGRSLSQNNYLHLILSWWGLEQGYTLEETKQDIFKRIVCKDIFVSEKKGMVVFKSTKNLDTLEMTNAIEKFRNWSEKEFGIYLPSPDEKERLASLDEHIKSYGNRQYI